MSGPLAAIQLLHDARANDHGLCAQFDARLRPESECLHPCSVKKVSEQSGSQRSENIVTACVAHWL